jgi:ribosomal protein S18 acetylase RimI-like enzyme
MKPSSPHSRSVWRIAQPADDAAVVEMCVRLYEEDPGLVPVPPENMIATLRTLRQEPFRGRAVVLDMQEQISGYALLMVFWSNELGGEICEVDELFVAADHRNQGHGTALFNAIAQGDLWPAPVTAIVLGTTPDNVPARRLYERLGFGVAGVSMVWSNPL